MVYDTFEIKGNCRGCGVATEWHINGEYPLCINCMEELIGDVNALINNIGIKINTSPNSDCNAIKTAYNRKR